MTLRLLCIPAALALSTALLAPPASAQARPAAPESPYGGLVVEDIVARVNDQIITRSDYDRALKELDQEGKQHGASMQEISEAHKDLLRDLIDRQLWLSKGKELGINGETELIQRLNEIRKQYNMESLEDLEKAAKEQGVSFEDFKANIRNGIITQQVMRDQVGRKIQFTEGEVQRWFEQHKQEYTQQESVKLSEILISTGSGGDDAAKLDAAKSKADDIEAKLHAGGDFSQLAKSFSDGTTAAQGGEFGNFHHGELAKVFEDATFNLQPGQYTEPIRTKQGLLILKVDQHIKGGIPAFKDVQQEVEQNYYMARMEPAMRDYLTQMREEAYVDIKPGYTDTGASAKEIKPVYSAYAPPQPKKKKKVERTRFRETTRTFRQKSGDTTTAAATGPATKQNASLTTTMKPGKKEKIRFGQAPTKTLPNAAPTATEDAGATATQTASTANEPANPLDATNKPTEKTRFSQRPKEQKKPKQRGPSLDPLAPAAADSAEVADRQTQSAPLGLSGDTSKKKKKTKTTTEEKTRLEDKKGTGQPKETPQPVPIPPVPGAPAPATAPQAPAAPASGTAPASSTDTPAPPAAPPAQPQQ
jgi:peptidyl-prolyl cis-trans isomerase SurA